MESGILGMTWHETLSLVHGFGVLVGVWWGIYVMNSNAKERAIEAGRKHDETMQKHEENMAAIKADAEESKRRHEETMSALKALIERTGG